MSEPVQGKGNTLDAIAAQDSSLTGRYLRIDPSALGWEEQAEAFMRQDSDADYLLRSDSSCEDRATSTCIATFAGLFRSLDVDTEERTLSSLADEIATPLRIAAGHTSPESIAHLGKEQSVEMLRHAAVLKEYAALRGVSLEGASMHLILHERQYGTQALLTEHPNMPDTLHVERGQGREWYIDDMPAGSHFAEKGMNKLVRAYRTITGSLRASGALREDLAYVAEAIVTREDAKIVQLRPFFRRDIQEQGDPRVLGTIPKEGLVFEWDEGTRSYEGLVEVATLHSLWDRPAHLDVSSGLSSRLTLSTRPGNNGYLSHASLLRLEGTQTFDNSLFSPLSFNSAYGTSRIRYFQKHPGENGRAFEKLP